MLVKASALILCVRKRLGSLHLQLPIRPLISLFSSGFSRIHSGPLKTRGLHLAPVLAKALTFGVLAALLMDFLNTDEKKQRRLVHLPMGRFGEAVELAKAALFRE